MSFFKESKRYVIEFVLIFTSVVLSVVLAFYFEDYRENRREKNEYLGTLVQFRNEVHNQIGTYRVDNSARNDSILWALDSILTDQYPNNNPEVLIILPRVLRYSFGTRAEVPSLNQLLNFSSFILQDSLSDVISEYQRRVREDFDLYQAHNKELDEWFRYSKDKIINYPPDHNFHDDNNEVANSKYLKNMIFSLTIISGQIIRSEYARSLTHSAHVISIDKRLANYGIDTTTLDRSALNPYFFR